MYEISKSFDFCYGHRVHSQTLNKEYSLDSCLACRHFHGHQGKIIVTLNSNELIDGMVTDFKHLGWFKKWLDDTLDHKFIMDINDPLILQELSIIDERYKLSKINTLPIEKRLKHNKEYNYKYVDKSLLFNIPNYYVEKLEGMIFVDFVPTSENLSKWLYDIVSNKMSKININTKRLEFYETPKSKSVYSL